MMQTPHIPVLSHKLIELVKPAHGQRFLDCTAGFGGHSELLFNAVAKSGYGYLNDQDSDAQQYLSEKFSTQPNCRLLHKPFGEINLADIENKPVDIVIADLGVSSKQLSDSSRGFSFQLDGPLDMRMDIRNPITASHIVNTYTKAELTQLFRTHGQAPGAARVAQAITQSRQTQPITSTRQLQLLISSVVHSRSRKIDPATTYFQALRMEVNQEVDQLQLLLEHIPSLLAVGGRVALISFHSGEDRLVKQAFRAWTTPVRNERGAITQFASFVKVTNKAIKGEEFDKTNPRARSARLRVVEKIN
jgi:16S rRNA (cytosine1402-N4)-methyltransferase